MGTIQISSNWEDRPQVKKGNYGEKLARKYLESQGFVVYTPVTKGAHAFDKLAVKDKRQAIIAECKTKTRRRYYEDTGINIKHYQEYRYISEKHNLPVFIFFIDEHLGEIYGGFLKELDRKTIVQGKEYPSEEKGIRYFPLENMRRNIAKLSESDCEYLKQHSQRNYSYGD